MSLLRVRRPAVVVGVVALVGTLLVPLASPASAQVVAQASIVSANPADFTPNVLDGKVESLVQIGSTIIAGGSFSQVQEVGAGKPVLNRSNIFAFNATTGVVSTSFAPNVAGEVTDIESAGDNSSIYISGSFSQVNSSASSRVARLSLSNGAKVTGFTVPTINAVVKNLDLVGSNLLIGGSFSSVGGQARTALASLNPATGALTTFVSNLTFAGPINGGVTQAYKMAVTPNGSRLVVIGNFTTINGSARSLIAMFDLTTPTVTLANWATDFYSDSCSDAFDTYMRDLDFSPDGSYFVVSTTGAYGGPDAPCDVISRWDTAATGTGLSATWRDYTGGDTTYAVAVTGAAVYVGGHMRWMNNPYAGDAAGPGAVPREGIAALDPVSGLPLSWNPGRARGVGVFDLLSTPAGLWAGSDTDRIGGETHRKLAFFPLAGGTALPAQVLGTVPNDVYALGRTGGTASSDVLYRVNAGGPALLSADDGPDWIGDADADAAGYKLRDSATAGYDPVPTLNASVPQVNGDRAPAALFSSESWGPNSGNEMGWRFPVPAGQAVTVRLYLANRYSGTSMAGQRVYDILVDGAVAFPSFDPVAAFGDQVGGMRSVDVVSNGEITIDFKHIVENPLINGIEIIRQGTGGGGGGTLTAADDVQRRYLATGSVGATTVLTPTAQWSLDRGSFLLDGRLYTGWADGTFSRRTFNGTTFGAPVTLPLYGGSFGSEVSNLTGIVYANGRIYYTLFGDDRLFWRWFTPQSEVVGATEFEVGGDVSALDPAHVQGMFLSGSTLYFADRAAGHLSKVSLTGTTVTGPATTVDTTNDWRARGLFLWNGTPAAAPNVNPTAVATGSCPPVGLTCSFDSSTSTDSDGAIVSRSWSFQGGGTSTAVAPQHAFPGGGTFTATLTVVDNRGGSNSQTISVDVVAPANNPPTATFTSSCSGLTCGFTGVGTDTDGTITSYAWSFSDAPDGTGTTPTHTFSAAGTYSVTLTVTDDDGDTGFVSHDVTVSDVAPSAVAYRGSAVANANSINVTVPAPSGMQAGDELLLFVTSAKGTLPTATPAGWTSVSDRTDGTDTRTALYRRLAPATTALGTVSWGTTTKSNLTVLAYSGAAATPAIVASAAKTSAASTTYTAPDVTVNDSGSAVVFFWALRGSAPAAWTPPAGTNERADSSGTGSGLISASAADRLAVGAGPVTGGTATTASSAKATTWTVVLKPL